VPDIKFDRRQGRFVEHKLSIAAELVSNLQNARRGRSTASAEVHSILYSTMRLTPSPSIFTTSAHQAYDLPGF
jgi:hypothetical protein